MVEPYVCDDLKQRYRFFSILAKNFESEAEKKNIMKTAHDFFIHLISQTLWESRQDLSFSPCWRCFRRLIFSPNLAIYRQVGDILGEF